MPLVSVVMPVHNGLAYLPQAVESILSQTHRRLELILWDDASTEAVWQYLVEAAERDGRVVLGRNAENEGLTRSLNHCLRRARGDIVARQDGDDWSLPTRLERQVAAIRGRVGLAGCWGRTVDQQGEPMADSYLDREARCDGAAVRERLPKGNCLCDSASSYSREAIDAVGLFDERLCIGQTYNYSLRIAARFEIAVVPEVLYVRRRHPGSVRRRHRSEPGIAELCRERARTHPVIREAI